MQANLKYYDGYFMHHISVYTAPAKDLIGRDTGKFTAFIHRSGTLPEAMRVGPRNPKDTDGFGYWDKRPLALFDTEEAALQAAKAVCEDTTGKWCKDFYYRA